MPPTPVAYDLLQGFPGKLFQGVQELQGLQGTINPQQRPAAQQQQQQQHVDAPSPVGAEVPVGSGESA